MSVVVNGVTKLTYADYVHLPDDGRRHEIIDGDHYVSPSPSSAHQDASRHIQFQLYDQIEEKGHGRIYDAPMDLQLSETDVVQPDLLLILAEHLHRISPSRIIGPPDLVVEILSPATKERDQTLKRSLYERSGVPEYWLVDLDNHVLDRYRAVDNHYQLVERCTERVRYSAEPSGPRAQTARATVSLLKVW